MAGLAVEYGPPGGGWRDENGRSRAHFPHFPSFPFPTLHLRAGGFVLCQVLPFCVAGPASLYLCKCANMSWWMRWLLISRLVGLCGETGGVELKTPTISGAYIRGK